MKIKTNRMILMLSIIIIIMWLVLRSRRSGYDENENKTGPTPDISQEELDVVMKFINR
jgi:hypothetical protein